MTSKPVSLHIRISYFTFYYSVHLCFRYCLPQTKR